MDKIKDKKRQSLKWALLRYLVICLTAAYLGTFAVGFGTNDLQDWYQERHPEVRLETVILEMQLHGNNQGEFSVQKSGGQRFNLSRVDAIYWVISYAQVILIPAWVIFCISATGILFYHFELKEPVGILFAASRKIADNQLDFKIEYKKQNELGMLCAAFDEMRSALYENNRQMWRSLEERKRLNSAFSHDLRTPLTVLKGYTDFLEKYILDSRVSQEKVLSVLSMMDRQILRLEHYTQKMNLVQKLEDIVPDSRQVSAEEIFAMLKETGDLMCGSRFQIQGESEGGMIFLDTELVMQVYENLISNAARYAKSSVRVNCTISEKMLVIAVLDDGKGFTEEALKNAAQPFFRDEKEPDKIHFGLGLYIGKILCEKCGGSLRIENDENGGKVTAEFRKVDKK